MTAQQEYAERMQQLAKRLLREADGIPPSEPQFELSLEDPDDEARAWEAAGQAMRRHEINS